MCGIVGAVAQRDVAEILMEGLKRLEYRGYDSAGMAVVNSKKNLECKKTVGKVKTIVDLVNKSGVNGHLGIAHTRWATHGKPSTDNAHPHTSHDELALVHNGIIENYEPLRNGLKNDGYQFTSETDTEVIVHMIHRAIHKNKLTLLDAVKWVIKELSGAYGICVIDKKHPDQIVAARSGSPLVVGVGIGENFVASDPLALGQVTDRFIYLEEGDVARITRHDIEIWHGDRKVNRPMARIASNIGEVDKGEYGHFMLKEIFEQPRAIKDTLDGRVSATHVLEEAFGIKAKAIFDKVKIVQIVACGTSFLAGEVAKYWLESIT
ncbi:MAG: isomerizing glutamine--fructose-6-phosphate transaminase, partial [Pseudohongiellaceae bacterium]